ncbi:MAG TPA: phage tail protein, partial [Rhizobiaceae bacterium]|nr:phage tail protein [Rhizobiaceae bacterium]
MAIITAGITSLLAGTALGTFFGTAVGSAILSTVVGLGISLAASAIAGLFTPEQAQERPFALQGKLQAAGTIGRSILFGLCATAGSLVYHNTWAADSSKTPNAFYTQVIALSDWPVRGLNEVWVNGEKVTLLTGQAINRGAPVQQYRVDGKDYLWVKFYDGTQTTHDAFLNEYVSSTDRPWETTRVGIGVSYAIVTALVNEELFASFPEYRFVLNGAKLYDPTRD